MRDVYRKTLARRIDEHVSGLPHVNYPKDRLERNALLFSIAELKALCRHYGLPDRMDPAPRGE